MRVHRNIVFSTMSPVSSRISRIIHSSGLSPASNLPPTPFHFPSWISFAFLVRWSMSVWLFLWMYPRVASFIIKKSLTKYRMNYSFIWDFVCLRNTRNQWFQLPTKSRVVVNPSVIWTSSSIRSLLNWNTDRISSGVMILVSSIISIWNVFHPFRDSSLVENIWFASIPIALRAPFL